MIGDLVNIYVSVADFDTVCKEICEDERSYSDDLLIDLGKTANKYKLVTPEKLGQMENLINKLIELQNTREEMKKLMEDLPEEFTCSLTAEMMKDPVKLPNSHSVVDRKSIKQHIMLNGNSDPFSRQALQLEEVIEMPELKAKIQDWYNKKIAQINLPRKKKVQINTGYEMDEEDLFHAQGEPEVDQGTNPFLSNFNGT